MEFPVRSMAAGLTLVAGLLFGHAQAALLSCSVNDVRVTGVSQYSDTTASAVLGPLYVPPAPGIPSAACAGAFAGNDGYYPTTNLGYNGDGLLNGGAQQPPHSVVLFPNPPGAFITSAYPLSDLDNDGQVNDPGWIMLGKYENGSFSPMAIGGDSSIVLSSFFSITPTGAGTGTWALTPDATVAQRASNVLGKNYFDQFAIVFKAGNSFAIYDFTAEQFGVIHPSADDPVFNFFGTYDTTGALRVGGPDGLKNPAGISHVSIWARDPAIALTVPEPGTFGLLGIALLGFGLARRRRVK